MSDYIRREDLEAVMQIACEEFLGAIIKQRREFEDAMRDHVRQIEALLGATASELESLVDLNRRCFSQLYGTSRVVSALSGITLYRGIINADAVLDIIASETDDATAVEFARSILGARPRLRVVASSNARTIESAGASDRARPSLSIVRNAPASPPERK
jgi:hypothetical protein